MKPFMSSSSPIQLAQGRLQRGSIHSFLALAALFLSACGDDITEQVTVNANVGAVTNSDDLPACTEEIAGQTAYIKETHEFLGCDGSEWQSLGAGTVSVGDNVCMSKSLSDGTGFEIFCNGESIGTVKNGEKGDPGEKGEPGEKGADGQKGDKGDDGAKGDPGDPGKNGTNGTDGTNGTSCEITAATTLTATIACGTESFTMDLTGYVEIPAECDASLYEDCAGPIDNVELSGVSQKGPFVTGADITAYELENGRSLKQTGKTFGGKIEREDGTFDIKTVKLKSPFVYLVADGFYRNEVTGEKSASPIKLRALTNRQNHPNTNINLVTHLEYDRIVYLVTKKDSTVMNAKKSAEKEIFAAFGIDNTGFKGFAEDYNVLEDGDGNAALLAISVLLQGDHTEAELTSLLASLSVDLGDNGEWDNKRERARIADWAMKKTVSREGLASIRKNIKAWNLRDGEPPAFEGHILNFWQNELGIGECSESNKNAIKAATNKYSAYYAQKDSVFTEDDSSLVRLICAADGESFAWRIATDIEKNTAALIGPSEGEYRLGSIDTSNVYVYEDGRWRDGTDLDVLLNSSCVAANLGAMKRNVATWYVCDSALVAWREATTAEADTVGFGMPDGDTARVGNVHKSNYYVYEMVDGVGKWRYGTERDVYDDLGPCTQNKLNVVARISNAGEDAGWYKCASDWAAVSNGEKVPHAWREATTLEADTAWINARAADLIGNYEKVILKGNLTRDSLNYYVYESGKWRRADTLEMDSYDTLTHTAWTGASDGDFRQGSVTKQYYVYCDAGYQNGSIIYRWRLETSPLEHDPDLGGCTYRKRNKIAHKKVGEDSLHYVCLNYQWHVASPERLNTEGYSCNYTKRLIYEGKRDKNQFYTCDLDTFRVITESEAWAHSVLPESQNMDVRCGPYDEGERIQLPMVKTRFICKNGYYEWDGRPSYWGNPLPTDGNLHPDEEIVMTWGGVDLPTGGEFPYEIVGIGTQIWFAKNLSTGKGGVMSDALRNDIELPPDLGLYYGLFYRHEDAVKACEDITYEGTELPSSYHLPTSQEWKVLFSYEPDEYYRAEAYKSKGFWPTLGGVNYGGDDRYKFCALPAGYAEIHENGELTDVDVNSQAAFWTKDSLIIEMDSRSQEIKQTPSYYKSINVLTKYVSARCIGDLDIPPAPTPSKW